jgi:hypothetical protein
LAHSPTLDTVLMVEECLRDAKEPISVAELKRRLPRKVNHNTLKVIIAYLQDSGKLVFSPYGLLWIHAPKEGLAGFLRTERIWRGSEREHGALLSQAETRSRRGLRSRRARGA